MIYFNNRLYNGNNGGVRYTNSTLTIIKTVRIIYTSQQQIRFRQFVFSGRLIRRNIC